MNKLIAHLTSTPKTVKQLAADAGLSESRTRELLKALGTKAVVVTDTKPALFSLPTPKEKAAKPAKAPKEIKAPAAIAARPEHGDCPVCKAKADLQIPAGDAGTLLGDTTNKCTACGKGWNIHDKSPVELPAVKSKRTPINPQSQIDAKAKVIQEAGGTLTYAKREWTIQIGKAKPVVLSSKDFSQYKGAEILKAVL